MVGKEKKMSVKEKIEFARENNWKICIYGLGQIGSGFCNELIDIFGIEVNYYCDRNTDVLETFGVDRNKKVTVNELRMSDENILIFLLLGEQSIASAIEEFKGLSNFCIITWQELMADKEVVESFWGFDITCEYRHIPKRIPRMQNKKIAVFTCITNGYDKLSAPQLVEDNCDYFFITDLPDDEKVENEEFYTRLNISEIIPIGSEYTPKGKNRYCKSHGYDIFKEYKYSIYVDGNIMIVGKISELINKIGNFGVAFHRLSYTNDVFAHAMSLAIRNRIRKEDAIVEMKKIAKEGFPFDYGVPECSVIVCDNTNIIAHRILDSWFVRYNQGQAKRDQLYLPYILWKMKISVDEVCTLPGNWRNNGYFEIVGMHSGLQE